MKPSKKTPGRPTLIEGLSSVHISLTPDQRTRLQKVAEEQGRSRAAVIRELIDSLPPAL